jgi:hypothetical protein
MYRSIAWLNALLVSSKRCPDWQRVPIALVVAVLLVAGVALTVVLGVSGLHHVVSASSIAWGRQ